MTTQGKAILMIHTLPPLVGLFNDLAKDFFPGMRILHVLDEPALERVAGRNALDETDAERLASHLMFGKEAGAQAALLTCSTLSPLVPELRRRVGFWIEAVDDAMAKRAVMTGSRIGVLATNPTTLEPTRRLLLREAALCGKSIEISENLVAGALADLRSGKVAEHDQRIAQAASDLVGGVEVIVLAQASMARAQPLLQDLPIPLLASPRLALESLRSHLERETQAQPDEKDDPYGNLTK